MFIIYLCFFFTLLLYHLNLNQSFYPIYVSMKLKKGNSKVNVFYFLLVRCFVLHFSHHFKIFFLISLDINHIREALFMRVAVNE